MSRFRLSISVTDDQDTVTLLDVDMSIGTLEGVRSALIAVSNSTTGTLPSSLVSEDGVAF